MRESVFQRVNFIFLREVEKDLSLLYTGNLGRSSWITMAQSIIKSLRVLGDGDYWKCIGRLLVMRCRLGSSELACKHWGDEGEDEFGDAKVNVVLGSQYDVRPGIIKRRICQLR